MTRKEKKEKIEEKIRDYSTLIEYKLLGETPVLILRRDKGDELTHICPFCGTKHIHGTSDGHRIAHCSTDSKENVQAPDGQFLFKSDGYILITT